MRERNVFQETESELSRCVGDVERLLGFRLCRDLRLSNGKTPEKTQHLLIRTLFTIIFEVSLCCAVLHNNRKIVSDSNRVCHSCGEVYMEWQHQDYARVE